MSNGSSGIASTAGQTWVDVPWSILLLMSDLWWSGCKSLLWPHSPARHLPGKECHCQLIVSDPIEAQGEHGLFA